MLCCSMLVCTVSAQCATWPASSSAGMLVQAQTAFVGMVQLYAVLSNDLLSNSSLLVVC